MFDYEDIHYPSRIDPDPNIWGMFVSRKAKLRLVTMANIYILT